MPKQSAKIKAVERSFEIVDLLATSDASGATDIAERLDIPISTVHDHLQTLTDLGYLIKQEGRYRVSTRFLEIGSQRKYNMDFFQTAKPELQKLARQTGEHANLMIEEDSRGVILHTESGEDAVKLLSPPGTRLHFHTTAVGKAILAYLPEQTVEEILDRFGLPVMTENTITERAELFEELDRIRERGYATDREEKVKGFHGVGVPILDYEDEVLGAIGVYGPSERIRGERLEKEIPDLLTKSRNLIEVNVNY